MIPANAMRTFQFVSASQQQKCPDAYTSGPDDVEAEPQRRQSPGPDDVYDPDYSDRYSPSPGFADPDGSGSYNGI